jgi:two-component system, sensor histidine kinase and response regulator
MDTVQVLIVDDSPVVRLVVTRLLEGMGISPDTVEDGLQAVNAVNLKAYDLVLMDVMMPNMDGYEATRQIRKFEEEEKRVPVPIIGTTSFSSRTACLDAGMDDYLLKPVSLEQLRGAMKTWVPKLALPAAETLSNMLTDSDVMLTKSELVDIRIADLKSRFGFGAGAGSVSAAK